MDWLALALLIVFIGALQVILEKGESEDWFDAPYITVLTIASAIAGIVFVWRQLTVEHPILKLSLLSNSQYAVGNFFSFIQGMGLFASIFIIPVFCQSMLGLTSEATGWLLMPGSLAAGAMMPVTAILMKKTKISPVVLAGIGFVLFIMFVWQLSSMSLSTGSHNFFWPLILRGIGLGLIFIPLLTITIAPLKSKDIPQGTAMSNMVRQLGGSFGIALATTYISARSMFHYNRISDHISVYNPTTYDRIKSFTGFFVSKGKDFNSAQLSAIGSVKASVYKQAMLLTFNDVFLIVGLFFGLCIPLLLLFRIKKKNVLETERQVEMHMAE
ncbi:MAG: MFS transporter, partial [Saprospiraceae bacterium]